MEIVDSCSATVHLSSLQLAEGMTISATAHNCGWATPSAFIESFRLATGQTPRIYQLAAI